MADWLAPTQDETRALNAGGRARELVFARWLEVHEGELRSGGPAARQTAQRLVERSHEAAGPIAAFQMLLHLKTRLQRLIGPCLSG